MKLYDTPLAPNPRRVRVFLAEKGIDIPKVTIDLAKLEQKSEAYAAINPRMRTPALELDDGSILCESIAICRYIEALHPEPNLFGRDPKEIGQIEMWSRRMELNLLSTIAFAFRHLHRPWPRWRCRRSGSGARSTRPHHRRTRFPRPASEGPRLHLLRPLHQCRHHRDDRHRLSQARQGRGARGDGRSEALACGHGGASERQGLMSGAGEVDGTAGLASLEAAIAACRICRDSPLGAPLPHEPRPVAWPSPKARILIAGQAPASASMGQAGPSPTRPATAARLDGDRRRDLL